MSTRPSDIISLWPSAEHFASDLGCKYLSYGRVMKLRNRIPERYWPAALEGATKRGLLITKDDLIAAHAPAATEAA